jgi:hypothetical protein
MTSPVQELTRLAASTRNLVKQLSDAAQAQNLPAEQRTEAEESEEEFIVTEARDGVRRWSKKMETVTDRARALIIAALEQHFRVDPAVMTDLNNKKCWNQPDREARRRMEGVQEAYSRMAHLIMDVEKREETMKSGGLLSISAWLMASLQKVRTTTCQPSKLPGQSNPRKQTYDGEEQEFWQEKGRRDQLYGSGAWF